MAEIKVLALDLDGTLTNDQKEVTPRTRAALDAAIERGVTVVLASGRPPPASPRWPKTWGWTKRAAASCPTTAARSWTAAPAKRWWKNAGPRAGPGAVRLCRRAGCDHPDLQQ